MNTSHNDVFTVEATTDDPRTIEKNLNAAEAIARERAMRDGRHGILVTQHDYNSFTVSVSEEVPYGQTKERREWLHVPAAGHHQRTARKPPPLPPGEPHRPAVLTHTAWAGWYEVSAEDHPMP